MIESTMERQLALCISLQITLNLLYIAGTLPEFNAYVGAIICLNIGCVSLVISLYLIGRKYSLGISFFGIHLFLFHHFHLIPSRSGNASGNSIVRLKLKQDRKEPEHWTCSGSS